MRTGFGQAELMPPATPAPSDWSDRRADARRNHERIVAAALEIFSEKGLQATVPEVAARAGVGKATVYRSYPTKADLVRAVADQELEWLRDRLSAIAEDDDPYTALGDFVGDASERLARQQMLLIEVLPRDDPRNTDSEPNRMLQRIIDAARDRGQIRADITPLDLRILVGGYARTLLDLGIRDPAQWRRYAELVMAALRP
jgi:AcrR family transcriptional regulator